MSVSETIKTSDDLREFLINYHSSIGSSKVRGIVIVPGGGGKSTIVKILEEKSIPCADIDTYWDVEQEKDRVAQMTTNWIKACKANDSIQRQQIENEYVLLKAQLSKSKWSNETTFDLLFVQTYEQASILLTNNICLALNLLPTVRLHHENLNKRSMNDFDVCQRQWQENHQQIPHIIYDTHLEFARLVHLFHHLIISFPSSTIIC